MVIYNPIDKFYKSQTGAIKENTLVTIRLKCSHLSCTLVVFNDEKTINKRIDMQNKGEYFEVSFTMKKGLYWYYFDLNDGTFVGINENLQGVETDTPQNFQLTFYDSNYYVPNWLKGGIIYQIFPDRFYRGVKEKNIEQDKILHQNWDELPLYRPNYKGEILNNDFFGGDFKGIQEKLSYIASLGVTAIYLNPIFKAYSNHRYDTGNYLEFDNLLGSEQDFRNLIKEANKYGIKLILDGVFNHTGADSIYFDRYGTYNGVGAFRDKNSKYRNWFNFIHYPDVYECWWNFQTLPSVNKSENSEFIQFITKENGVIERYVKMGIGGWRLDVVDELPNHFTNRIREASKRSNKETVLIGEVWEDATNKIAYSERKQYFQGKQLDSVMNYPLKNAILNYAMNGNSEQLSNIVNEQIDHYPKDALDILMNCLATHDTFRLLSSLSGIDVSNKNKYEMTLINLKGKELEQAIYRLKVATFLQFTLYGVPTIYYGDEIGMQGFKDPLNRSTFSWNNQNKEIQDWYKKLSGIRKKYDAFVDGEVKVLSAKCGIFVFSRIGKTSQVLVAINNGYDETVITFDKPLINLLDGKVYQNYYNLNKKEMGIFVREK